MVINIQTSHGACTPLVRTLRCASQVLLAREGSTNAVEAIYSKATYPRHSHYHSQACQPAATERLHPYFTPALRLTPYDSLSATRYTSMAPPTPRMVTKKDIDLLVCSTCTARSKRACTESQCSVHKIPTGFLRSYLLSAYKIHLSRCEIRRPRKCGWYSE